MAEAAQNNRGLISAEQAAQLVELSTERLRQLVKEGFIPPPPKRGFYTLVGVVRGCLNFYRDTERRATKVAAESKVRDARAREIELRIAEREGRVIDLEDTQDVFMHMTGLLRSTLSGIPAAYTRDLAERRRLEALITHAIDQFCGGLEAQIAALQGGAGASQDLPGDDA